MRQADTKEIYAAFEECGYRVTTDSRAIKGGELFVALKGENFDGNAYARIALEQGAAYALVNSDSVAASAGDWRVLPVENTLHSLWELARMHRQKAMVDGKPLKVLALTGTNGKTTTKELIRSVLSVKYRLTATEGNLNNNIGVPLTLLKITPETELAVVEMGASHPGDIKELVDIALPDYALVTNVGKAHLLGFGSFEGVKATKGEMYDYIKEHGGEIFCNEDSSDLRGMVAERGMSAIGYGLEYQGAKVLSADAGHPFLRIELADGTAVNTHLVGAYNADNVMAALAVGARFGVPQEDAVRAIEAYIPENKRSQMVCKNSNVLIVDAYNANPTSMAAALENFASVDAPYKIAMLGMMGELGAEEAVEHENILAKLGLMNLDKVYLVGQAYRNALRKVLGRTCEVPENVWLGNGSTEIGWFASSDDLASWIGSHKITGAYVLIKGSRSTKMEKCIDVL